MRNFMKICKLTSVTSSKLELKIYQSFMILSRKSVKAPSDMYTDPLKRELDNFVLLKPSKKSP